MESEWDNHRFHNRNLRGGVKRLFVVSYTIFVLRPQEETRVYVYLSKASLFRCCF